MLRANFKARLRSDETPATGDVSAYHERARLYDAEGDPEAGNARYIVPEDADSSEEQAADRRRPGHNASDLSRHYLPGDHRRSGPATAYPLRDPGSRDGTDRYPPDHIRRSQSPPRLQRSNVADVESRTSGRRRSPPASTGTREAVVRPTSHPPPTPHASVQLSHESAAAILATMQTTPVTQIARTYVQSNDTASRDRSTVDSITRSPSPGRPPRVVGEGTEHAPSVAGVPRTGHVSAVAPSTVRRSARDPLPVPPAQAAYAAGVPPAAHHSVPPPFAHGYPQQMQYGQPPPIPHGYPQYMGHGYAPPPQPPMAHKDPAYMHVPAAHAGPSAAARAGPPAAVHAGPPAAVQVGAPAAVRAGPPAAVHTGLAALALAAAAVSYQPVAYPAATDSPTYPRFTEGMPPPPPPPLGHRRRYLCYGFSCNRVFDRLAEYETHMRLHEEKPFKCEVCVDQKAFTATKGRRRHVRDQHNLSPYRDYV